MLSTKAVFKNGAFVVDSTLPNSLVLDVVSKGSGKRAVLQAFGDTQSAVAMVSNADSSILGVVHLQQQQGALVVDGSVDGLTPGLHGLHLHETGVLSRGCASLGPHYNPHGARHAGNLGNIRADARGRANFRIVDRVLDISDIIGSSIAITERADDLGLGLCPIPKIACGIIDRSAGEIENPKRICACDGVVVWDERDRPLGGTGRRCCQKAVFKNGAFVVDNTLPSALVLDVVSKSSGKRAVLQGFGDTQSAVAMVSNADSSILGVVRLQQQQGALVADGSVDGLTPGLHGLYLHETGVLSRGCASLGPHYNPHGARHAGDLGNIRADARGRANFRIVDRVLDISDIIGSSIAITERADDLGLGSSPISKIACGIIDRSAGVFENPKRICACDGVVVWDERDRPLGGMGRRCCQKAVFKNGAFVVDNTLPSALVLDVVSKSSGKRAVLQGFGDTQSAVAMVSNADSSILGVVRLQQQQGALVADGSVDGLTPGLHGLYLHETGVLSRGCASLGPHYNPHGARHAGDLGNIRADARGRANFRIVDRVLDISDIIGSSIAITERADDLGLGSSPISKIACGIIDRSAGVFENPKRICACDGVVVWDERDRPLGGMGRRCCQKVVTGVFTGHVGVRALLTKMGLTDNADCRMCGEEEETAQHLLCECHALARLRMKDFGYDYLEPKEFKALPLSSIIRFMEMVQKALE